MTTHTPNRLARAALTHFAGLGTDAAHTHRLADQLGPTQAWARLRDAGCDIDPERDLDRIAELGGRFLTPDDPDWPAGLNDLCLPSAFNPTHDAGPPFGLWTLGNIPLPPNSTDNHVAIVGSRAATPYGQHVTAQLAGGLAERGWTIVSGGAFGIDVAAHRAALAEGAATVAVLACGVDVAYPFAHKDLFAQIRENGAIVSELPPGTTPQRPYFLARNRIVAALTRATVIVEAGLRSGTLNTARHARQLGRPVLAVPGPVTSAQSAGCHQLIRDYSTTHLVGSPAAITAVIGDPLAAQTGVNA
jgi:DNA processing protein